MAQFQVSDRMIHVPASPTRKLAAFASEAKKRGIHVYHLNIGDPDIKTPEVMIDALKRWDINPIPYGQSQGEPAYLDALTSYYHSLGFTFLSPSDIQVTTGGSEAISIAMFGACNPGEEILVFEPFYANYNSYATIDGVKLVPVPTDIQTGFHLPTREEIEKYIVPETRAILFCSPNNPTGTVYTKEEMDMLVSLAKQHGLYLLSDEVYREYSYDGKKPISLLSYMRDIPDQAIVLDSMSKRYSVCGLRLGALITLNKDIMSGALHVAQGRLSSGYIGQVIASKISEVPAAYIEDVQKEYERRRDTLYEGLKSIPGVVVAKPEGAFYTIVGLPVDDAEKFAQWLLTDFSDGGETVMFAPGPGFYATPGKGKNEVRIAYVLNVDAIKRSVEILRKALRQYANT